MMEMLSKALVVNILQYIGVSNQYVDTWNFQNVLYQSYLNKAGGGERVSVSTTYRWRAKAQIS